MKHAKNTSDEKQIESMIIEMCKSMHICCDEPEENIFYAGADSLSIVCLLAFIENEFNVQIGFDFIYPNSSIRSISEKISTMLEGK